MGKREHTSKIIISRCIGLFVAFWVIAVLLVERGRRASVLSQYARFVFRVRFKCHSIVHICPIEKQNSQRKNTNGYSKVFHSGNPITFNVSLNASPTLRPPFSTRMRGSTTRHFHGRYGFPVGDMVPDRYIMVLAVPFRTSQRH